jgi:hypothetical protein
MLNTGSLQRIFRMIITKVSEDRRNMLTKSDMPDLPGKKIILARTGDTFEIVSVRIVRWAGLVAVLRDITTGQERELAIHNARLVSDGTYIF